MNKVIEQLIRIEAKLELLIDIIKAKNSNNKEPISQAEYNRRRDEMIEQRKRDAVAKVEMAKDMANR